MADGIQREAPKAQMVWYKMLFEGDPDSVLQLLNDLSHNPNPPDRVLAYMESFPEELAVTKPQLTGALEDYIELDDDMDYQPLHPIHSVAIMTPYGISVDKLYAFWDNICGNQLFTEGRLSRIWRKSFESAFVTQVKVPEQTLEDPVLSEIALWKTKGMETVMFTKKQVSITLEKSVISQLLDPQDKKTVGARQTTPVTTTLFPYYLHFFSDPVGDPLMARFSLGQKAAETIVLKDQVVEVEMELTERKMRIPLHFKTVGRVNPVDYLFGQAVRRMISVKSNAVGGFFFGSTQSILPNDAEDESVCPHFSPLLAVRDEGIQMVEITDHDRTDDFASLMTSLSDDEEFTSYLVQMIITLGTCLRTLGCVPNVSLKDFTFNQVDRSSEELNFLYTRRELEGKSSFLSLKSTPKVVVLQRVQKLFYCRHYSVSYLDAESHVFVATQILLSELNEAVSTDPMKKQIVDAFTDAFENWTSTEVHDEWVAVQVAMETLKKTDVIDEHVCVVTQSVEEFTSDGHLYPHMSVTMPSIQPDPTAVIHDVLSFVGVSMAPDFSVFSQMCLPSDVLSRTKAGNCLEPVFNAYGIRFSSDDADLRWVERVTSLTLPKNSGVENRGFTLRTLHGDVPLCGQSWMINRQNNVSYLFGCVLAKDTEKHVPLSALLLLKALMQVSNVTANCGGNTEPTSMRVVYSDETTDDAMDQFKTVLALLGVEVASDKSFDLSPSSVSIEGYQLTKLLPLNSMVARLHVETRKMELGGVFSSSQYEKALLDQFFSTAIVLSMKDLSERSPLVEVSFGKQLDEIISNMPAGITYAMYMNQRATEMILSSTGSKILLLDLYEDDLQEWFVPILSLIWNNPKSYPEEFQIMFGESEVVDPTVDTEKMIRAVEVWWEKQNLGLMVFEPLKIIKSAVDQGESYYKEVMFPGLTGCQVDKSSVDARYRSVDGLIVSSLLEIEKDKLFWWRQVSEDEEQFAPLEVSQALLLQMFLMCVKIVNSVGTSALHFTMGTLQVVKVEQQQMQVDWKDKVFTVNTQGYLLTCDPRNIVPAENDGSVTSGVDMVLRNYYHFIVNKPAGKKYRFFKWNEVLLKNQENNRKKFEDDDFIEMCKEQIGTALDKNAKPLIYDYRAVWSYPVRPEKMEVRDYMVLFNTLGLTMFSKSDFLEDFDSVMSLLASNNLTVEAAEKLCAMKRDFLAVNPATGDFRKRWIMDMFITKNQQVVSFIIRSGDKVVSTFYPRSSVLENIPQLYLSSVRRLPVDKNFPIGKKGPNDPEFVFLRPL